MEDDGETLVSWKLEFCTDFFRCEPLVAKKRVMGTTRECSNNLWGLCLIFIESDLSAVVSTWLTTVYKIGSNNENICLNCVAEWVSWQFGRLVLFVYFFVRLFWIYNFHISRGIKTCSTKNVFLAFQTGFTIAINSIGSNSDSGKKASSATPPTAADAEKIRFATSVWLIARKWHWDQYQRIGMQRRAATLAD